MNRLWVRLILAFALVILVAVGVIALLAGLTAGREFRRYLTYSGAWPTQVLVDLLADFYQARGGWQGVEAILEREAPFPDPWIGTRHDRPDRLQFVLADASGRVVYDGVEGHPGRRLTRAEEAAAQEIVVGGATAGKFSRSQ